MTISELIKILDDIQAEHGDVPVENERGAEIFAVAHVLKGPIDAPETIAVTLK